MLLLLLGTHIYFTFRLGFIQKRIPHGIRLSFSATVNKENGISPFAALSTALAATIGTGNIIGISTAIAIGGPGAVFWCWITGIFGIATCYSECLLSFLHRVDQPDGTFVGGPMYVLKNVLNKKFLASLFAIATILVSFGMGSSVQSHAICSAITEHIRISPDLVGIILTILAGCVLFGEAKQISKICTFLVPFMSIFYLLSCFYLLFLNRNFLCDAIFLIIKSAFSSNAVGGGIAGTSVMLGIRTGISRGLFTNEAGLGSIPMTACSSHSSSPVTQSLISMTGPFWDTVVICAITGLVIVSSMLSNPSLYHSIPMDALCFAAFSQLPFYGTQILSISLMLFAFATILGWCYYGKCCVYFLVGKKGLYSYKIFYLLFIYLGTILSLNFVWELSDIFNVIMMLPNLFCLWFLRKEIIQVSRKKHSIHLR